MEPLVIDVAELRPEFSGGKQGYYSLQATDADLEKSAKPPSRASKKLNLPNDWSSYDITIRDGGNSATFRSEDVDKYIATEKKRTASNQKNLKITDTYESITAADIQYTKDVYSYLGNGVYKGQKQRVWVEIIDAAVSGHFFASIDQFIAYKEEARIAQNEHFRCLTSRENFVPGYGFVVEGNRCDVHVPIQKFSITTDTRYDSGRYK